MMGAAVFDMKLVATACQMEIDTGRRVEFTWGHSCPFLFGRLQQFFRLIHQDGNGRMRTAIGNTKGYRQSPSLQ